MIVTCRAAIPVAALSSTTVNVTVYVCAFAYV